MSDLISRQDAIDALEKQLDYLRKLDKNENPSAEGKWYGVNWARNTIADLPSAIARPQGEWVVEKNKFGDILHCPICGARPRRSEYGYDLHDKFCNECGADMRKGDKE